MKLLDILSNLPKTAVYGLINEKDKAIYLTHCRDVIVSLNRIMEGLRNGSNETGLLEDYRNNKLDIVILNTESDKLRQLQLIEWYKDEYRNKGYKLYNNHVYIRYTVTTEINGKFVYVVLKNGAKSKTIVGVFKSIWEAKEFINGSYPSKIYFPIYASNDLTKKYLAEIGRSNC